MANTEKIVVQVVVQGEKDLQRLERRTGTTTKSFGRMAAGVLGAVSAFRQITSVVSSAIRSFRDFEFQMAKVKAITGASNVDFKKLSQTAQDLGRSTFFTAQQVAELQTNFGKLGFSTKEILQAQEATLNLATATDSDLARAAIVAGAAVRGFGLNAKETARVTDVMASAFTSSALDLEKFQTSMTKVAPIAAAANISLEATTSVMGTLTDAGIEASIAGTSLRNIFLQMQDPSSKLAKHLGFTVKSSDDLQKALNLLNNSSDETLTSLVKVRQVAAFRVMVRGAERVNFLTQQLNLANGSAEQMAGIVGDTLEGAFKRLVSATEGLQIAFMGTGGGLTNFINRIADFTNRITDSIAPQETQIEMLQRTTQEMDSQFSLLTEGNLSQEARVQIIQNLNTEYADYLPHLISEKDGLKDIKDMQLEVNNLMMERVLIMAMEEELAELAEKQTKAIKGQTNSNIDLAKSEKERLTADENNFQQIENNIEITKLFNEANKEVVDNFDKDKETLIEGYKETAKQLGLSFKNIMDSLNAAKKAKKDADEDGDTTVVNDTKDRNQALLNLQLEYAEALTLAEGKSIEEREAYLKGLETFYNDDKLQVQLDFINAQLANTKTSEEEKIRLKQQYAQLELNEEKRLQGVKLQNMKDEQAANFALQDAKAKALNGYLNIAAGFAEEGSDLAKAIFLLQQAMAVKDVVVTNFRTNAMIMAEGLALAIPTLGASVATAKALVTANNIMSALSIAGIIAQTVTGLSKKARGGMIEEYANGGMVYGRSHAQGGEKFAVGGRVVELEGGEAVINKRSTAMFRNQLSAMNAAGGGVKFADGGMLNMPQFSQQQFNALGQSQMMGAVASGSKVVVVESDITESQNSVSVIQSDARL